jgi:L-ascorbate metabolism protein UlaG (beta-lactamase superfamily)
MEKIIGLLFTVAVFSGMGFAATDKERASLLDGVAHFKQSTVRIQGSKVIYFDPFLVSGEPHDGDIVLITHPHSDHFSIPDLKKVAKPGVTVVITEDSVEKAKAAGFTRVIGVAPNQDHEVEGIKFTTVPAYNVNKNFHPRANHWVGYIVNINRARYYMAGDTDLIPEMKGLKVDVAFLPVGGTYTMTAVEAAQAANLIKPKIAVPVHFGDRVGSNEDGKKFVTLLDKEIEGVVLKN